MRKATTIKAVPATAVNFQTILDLILQLISVLEAIARVFGIDLTALFGGGGGGQ